MQVLVSRMHVRMQMNNSVSKLAFEIGFAFLLVGMWKYYKFHKSILQDFPDSSVGKESACNVGDPGSIPGLGRSA